MATGLAPELLGLIFGVLNKASLKEARLTCRAFEQAASRHLFDTIYLSTDQADCIVAKLVIQRFASFVRTLVYSSRYYPHLDRRSHYTESKQKGCPRDHLDQGYHDYVGLRLSQLAFIKSQEHVFLIIYALTAASNIRNVILTDKPTTRVTPKELLTGFDSWGILEACGVEGCTLSAEEHREFQPDKVSSYTCVGSKPPEDPWKPVLVAMWTTGASIQEIVMEPKETVNGGAISISRFQIAQRHFLDARVSFMNLTRLELSLALNKVYERGMDCDGIPNMLEMSPNLQRLSVSILYWPFHPPASVTTFEAILGHATLHKLRYLKLFHIWSTVAELLNFLGNSNRLEHLSLYNHFLDQGSWETFADRSKQLLPGLKSVRLCHSLERNHQNPGDSTGAVMQHRIQDFYFHGGRNPFAVSTGNV